LKCQPHGGMNPKLATHERHTLSLADPSARGQSRPNVSPNVSKNECEGK
jgi:hypothetical protein